VLTPSGKFVTAQLIHFENGTVLEASTKEWCIKKHLFKTSDTAAYVNLARVFADRCLQSGILEMSLKPASGAKFEKFVDVLKENGLSLQESPDIYMYVSRSTNRFKGRRMQPEDWKEIVEHH
jgi:large subunit ribosomal protein L18